MNNEDLNRMPPGSSEAQVNQYIAAINAAEEELFQEGEQRRKDAAEYLSSMIPNAAVVDEARRRWVDVTLSPEHPGAAYKLKDAINTLLPTDVRVVLGIGEGEEKPPLTVLPGGKARIDAGVFAAACIAGNVDILQLAVSVIEPAIHKRG